MDDTPDYTRYSFDDLLDVERRINKRLYPERYALVLQEIEKRRNAPKPVPVASEPVPDGPFLKLVRFCGGLVLGAAIPQVVWLVVLLVSNGAVEVPFLRVLSFFLAVVCAYYFAFQVQECGTAREEFYPAEEIPRILNPSAFQNFLSGVLRFCGGGLLTAIATIFLWLNLMPRHGPNYGDGIGYGMAMMFWALIAGCVGGVVFICLPLGRTSRNNPKQE